MLARVINNPSRRLALSPPPFLLRFIPRSLLLLFLAPFHDRMKTTWVRSRSFHCVTNQHKYLARRMCYWLVPMNHRRLRNVGISEWMFYNESSGEISSILFLASFVCSNDINLIVAWLVEGTSRSSLTGLYLRLGYKILYHIDSWWIFDRRLLWKKFFQL